LVCLISLLLFLIVKYFIDHLFIKGGLYIGESISLLSIIGLIVIFILFTLLSLRVVKKEVNKLF
jgi:hypothetical protein